jgi:hypothetical protein
MAQCKMYNIDSLHHKKWTNSSSLSSAIKQNMKSYQEAPHSRQNDGRKSKERTPSGLGQIATS